MKPLARIKRLFRPGTKSATRLIGEHLATLEGVDEYGLPPTSVFGRFSASGEDYHGQCSMAQGGKGIGTTLKLSLDAAKVFAPAAPVSLQAGASVTAERLSTSAIVLFRLATSEAGKGAIATPISLTHLAGVSWSGKLAVEASAGIGTGFATLGNLDLSASAGAGAAVDHMSTRLVDAERHFFTDANRADLYAALDAMTELEIKKACVAFLAAAVEPPSNPNPDFIERQRERVAAAARERFVAVADEMAKNEVATFTELDAWKFIPAGLIDVDASHFTNKFAKALVDFLDGTSAKYKTASLLNALNVLEGELKKLPKTGAGAQSKLVEIEARIPKLRAALEKRKASKATPRKAFKPTKKALENQAAASLSMTITGFQAEAKAVANAKGSAPKSPVKLPVTFSASGSLTASTNAGLVGNKLGFRFQLQTPTKGLFIQDTSATYFQMTAEAAVSAGFDVSGFDMEDARLHAATHLGHAGEVGRGVSTHSYGSRRYGALTYRAATGYYAPDTKRLSGQVSGLSLGVSVRLARLCHYAIEVRAVDPGKPPNGKSWLDFEAWLSSQIGIDAIALRHFFIETPIGLDSLPGPGEEPAYPSDALLIETSFEAARPMRLDAQKMTNGVPKDLFEVFGYKGRRTFKANTTLVHATTRLRCRIQSPMSKFSKTVLPLGLPLKGVLPVDLSINFNAVQEVGQEGIFDLYTKFQPQVMARADSDRGRHEATVPPVALFNRG